MRLHPGHTPRVPLSAEIDWCHQHPDVPEAARVLALHAAASDRDGEVRLPDGTITVARDPAVLDALVAAVADLRKVNARPMALVDRFYAYVAWSPQNRSEGFVAAPDGPLLAPLIGSDLEHMRSMRADADELRRLHPGVRMTLWRYALDRVIPTSKVAHLRSRNLQSRTAVEMFAWVGVQPTTGDETVTGAQLSWKDARLSALPGMRVPDDLRILMPLVHGDAEAIVAWKPITDRLLREGAQMELRRFVRAETVDEASF